MVKLTLQNRQSAAKGSPRCAADLDLADAIATLADPFEGLQGTADNVAKD